MFKNELTDRANAHLSSKKLDYATTFRQSDDNMGAGNSRGAQVAAPCIIKHPIAHAGKPETGKRGG